MPSEYKINNPEGIYFITFATVGWIDVFTRKEYKDVFLDSIRFCQKEKGLIVYSWILMSNHVHMIVRASGGNLSDILRDMKGFTSRRILKLIQAIGESRREWMMEVFEIAGSQNSNNKTFQFWQQDNHPKEIISNSFGQQKLEYIHNNAIEAGIVENAEDYLYSSARNYAGIKGLIEVEFLE